MLSTVIVKKPTNVTLIGGLVTPRAGENQSNDIHRSSLRFVDTVLDILTSGVNADVGIANAWSVGVWNRPVFLNQTQNILTIREGPIGGGSSTNRTSLNVQNNNVGRIRLFDSSAVEFKDYRFVYLPAGGSASRWTHWIWTWDGTDLIGYRGGAAQTPTSTPTDNAGTMTQTDRIVIVGGDSFGNHDGHIHQIYMWNSVLGANEVASLYNNGIGSIVDASRNFGDYNSSANLVHWYRLGKIATFIGMGKDFKGNLDLS